MPLGYLGDADKTARTFPVIDGVRYSVPGDRARHLARRRRSSCSAATRSRSTRAARRSSPRRSSGPSPGTPPCTTWSWSAGRASAGASEVVALVELSRGRVGDRRRASSTHAGQHIARYKLPKACLFLTASSAARPARPTTAGPRPRSTPDLPPVVFSLVGSSVITGKGDHGMRTSRRARRAPRGGRVGTGGGAGRGGLRPAGAARRWAGAARRGGCGALACVPRQRRRPGGRDDRRAGGVGRPSRRRLTTFDVSPEPAGRP